MTTKSAGIYCGNNENDLVLKAHGGDREFGSHKYCLRKGYALGMNQHIPDIAKFLNKWSAPYKPHILQRLYYGDGEAPPGYQLATLGQSVQRGFALGSIARARKERARARAWHGSNLLSK